MCVCNNNNYKRRDHELERKWEIHWSSCRGNMEEINGINIVVSYEILKK